MSGTSPTPDPAPPHTSATEDRTRPAILLDDVTVRYGSRHAIDGVSVEVPAGQRLALLGSSGSGKTTLLSVLAGAVRPTSGQVRVLGVAPADVTGRAARAHGRRVGQVTQSLDLPGSLSVIHNVNAGLLGRWSTVRALASLVRPIGRTEVEAALDQVGLGDRAGSPTGLLSGGERQRVAVARVLRQSPEVVLADEPTSSVDPALADQVFEALLGLPATQVFSAHDPALARRHVDRLIGLRAGRIVFDATPADLSDDDVAELYR